VLHSFDPEFHGSAALLSLNQSGWRLLLVHFYSVGDQIVSHSVLRSSSVQAPAISLEGTGKAAARLSSSAWRTSGF